MIKRYVDNIDGSPDDAHDCEVTLGSLENLNTMAEIWKEHSSLFQIIELKSLIDYCYGGSHSSAESAAFKAGVEAFGKFMADCLAERGYRQEQANQLIKTDETT